MFIEHAEKSTADGDVAAYLEEEERAWGFVPDYAGCFTGRPEVARAWRRLNLTIREGMDRRVYELASIAVARARRSTYCTVAHSSFLRDVCGDEESLRLIHGNPTGHSLAPRDAAIFHYATKIAVDPSAITEADVDELRAQGLSDGDVADVAYAASARLFFTAVLDALGAQADAATAATFDPALLSGMVVGRAPLSSPAPPGS